MTKEKTDGNSGVNTPIISSIFSSWNPSWINRTFTLHLRNRYLLYQAKPTFENSSESCNTWCFARNCVRRHSPFKISCSSHSQRKYGPRTLENNIQSCRIHRHRSQTTSEPYMPVTEPPQKLSGNSTRKHLMNASIWTQHLWPVSYHSSTQPSISVTNWRN